MIKRNLFLTSFVLLFTELALIRWTAANIRSMGYFGNLVLLATFLGMGLGLLISRRKLLPPLVFPTLMAVLIGLVSLIRLEANLAGADIIFFKALGPESTTSSFFILPLLYFLITLVFLPLGQMIGSFFQKLSPLVAYSVDISGSIFGIISFSLLSYLQTPAYLWFVVIFTMFFFIRKSIGIIVISLLIVTTANLHNQNSTWSPYSRIVVSPYGDAFDVFANNTLHQIMGPWNKRDPMYFAHYDVFPKYTYKNALIIGSGTGTDVAITLAKNPNIEHIDAVEIDPELAAIGKRMHPDKPYQDPRVRLIVDDGRNFLQNTPTRYDLIIYALPDSLMVTATSANIRLESFLFTKESFTLARNHLSDTGVFVLYNYFRKAWLIDKLAATLEDVFGQPPYVITYLLIDRAGSLLAGPLTQELKNQPNLRPYQNTFTNPLATDDWPFLYMQQRVFSSFYAKLLAVITAISLALFAFVSRKQKFTGIDWRFFFYGAGFMLLETKSLVIFGLLFGTTWVVNSLVFTGILLSVLIANVISTRYTIRSLWIVYILLFVSLAVSYFVPSSIFFTLPILPRYILTSMFYFFPIFCANILFGQLFKKQHASDVNLGINVLGAVFGGLGEYVSMVTGYQALSIIIIGFYAMSLYRSDTGRRVIQ